MLRGVLGDGGTASGAGIPGYDMAGKTGTANVVVDSTLLEHRSTSRRSSGWSRPTTRSCSWPVIVDRPQGSIYGGSVAAPAFQKIVGWAVPYFGISPPLSTHAPLRPAALDSAEPAARPTGAPTVGHPRHRVRQRRRRDPVADLAPGALAVEQPRVGERVEVLEHGLAGDRQPGGELGRGRRGLRGDLGEQRAAPGV